MPEMETKRCCIPKDMHGMHFEAKSSKAACVNNKYQPKNTFSLPGNMQYNHGGR